MKTIGSFMSALSAVFLGAADACASLSDGRLSSVTSLIDTSQNQAFESQPPAQGLLTADLEPVHSFKLASVQFITGGGNLTFNTPEFPDTSTDNCKRFGYTLTSCSAGNPALFCLITTNISKNAATAAINMTRRTALIRVRSAATAAAASLCVTATAVYIRQRVVPSRWFHPMTFVLKAEKNIIPAASVRQIIRRAARRPIRKAGVRAARLTEKRNIPAVSAKRAIT